MCGNSQINYIDCTAKIVYRFTLFLISALFFLFWVLSKNQKTEGTPQSVKNP